MLVRLDPVPLRIKINVVSKLLGHKDVATTYKIY
jgi:integrase